MTTLNPTLTRRACDRLTAIREAEAPGRAQASRYTWLRVELPIPAAADSRKETPMLSTSVSTDLPRVLDMAALVGAAMAFVAVLGLVCR